MSLRFPPALRRPLLCFAPFPTQTFAHPPFLLIPISNWTCPSSLLANQCLCHIYPNFSSKQSSNCFHGHIHIQASSRLLLYFTTHRVFFLFFSFISYPLHSIAAASLSISCLPTYLRLSPPPSSLDQVVQLVLMCRSYTFRNDLMFE